MGACTPDWIPAYAGMTARARGACAPDWIPAYAGMTRLGARETGRVEPV